MKKTQYNKPAIHVVSLYAAPLLLPGSPKVQSLDNQEGLVLDDDGLDDEDDLR